MRPGRPSRTLSFSLCLSSAVSALPSVAPLREVLLPASAAPSLLQKASRRQRSNTATLSEARQQRSELVLTETAEARSADPKTADWFGDFSEMESTYDVGGMDAYVASDSARAAKNGVEMSHSVPVQQDSVQPAHWFHESPSAGAAAAWQTHYPAVDGSIAGNRDVADNPWRSTPEGWVQDYLPSGLDKVGSSDGPNPALWFDSSVNQLDGFGRERLPDVGDPRRLLADLHPWEKRAVNTTISCAEVGCTAQAELDAFDPASEEASNCVLNVNVHPTDFDEDYTKESVENWIVNGYSVNGKCEPMARGCNTTAARPLVSCLKEYPVHHLFNETNGKLRIKGTLSKMVDECPYEGNLLSGVVGVSCYVRPIPPPPETTTLPPSLAEVAKPITVSAPLRCKGPGCTATALLSIDPDLAFFGGKCFLNVTINQTDFDDDVPDAPERVEWLQLLGYGTGEDKLKNLTVDAKPGKNPCNSMYQGTVLTQAEQAFSLVTNEDVTDQVTAPPSGQIQLKGKISEHVDECASGAAGENSEDGYLFDGWITLRCEPPGVSATAVNESTAADDASASNSTSSSTASKKSKKSKLSKLSIHHSDAKTTASKKSKKSKLSKKSKKKKSS